MQSTNKNIIKFLILAVTVNLLLAVLKLLGGIYGDSEALISDAVHSLADVLSSLIVMVGIYFSQKNNDSSHMFGHERFECVASLLLSGLLFFTGISIGYKTLNSIVTSSYKNFDTPNIIALLAAVISIVAKEIMFWVASYFYKRTGLISLKADAWHQRIDAISSIGSLLGILGAMLGFPICDTIAGFIICLFILKIAIEIFIEACNRMVDKSCDEKLENQIKNAVLLCDGVMMIDDFRTRLFGAKIIVDMRIAVQNDLTLSEALCLAHNVEQTLKANFENIKSCSVLPIPCNFNA